MNGWDLFTWLNCALLAGSAIVIFGFFCRDAGGILKGQREDPNGESGGQPTKEEKA